jgi:hypothetical protein
MAHVIASTDLDQVLSRIATRQGLLDLVLGQYGLPTSTPAWPIKAGKGVARVCCVYASRPRLVEQVEAYRDGKPLQLAPPERKVPRRRRRRSPA